MRPDSLSNDPVFFRLLVVLGLLAVLPVTAISYIIYGVARSEHIEQRAVLLNSLAADRELMTRLMIEKRRDALGFIANDPDTARLVRDLAGRTGSSGDRSLERMARRGPFFAALSVVDMATGRHITAGTFPKEVLELSVLELKRKKEQSFVLAEALPDGERVLLFGQWIQARGKDSGSGGILLGLATLDMFNDLFKDTSMLGATGESFLSDSNGVALTPLRYSLHEKLGHPIDARAMLDCLAGNSSTFVITPDYVGAPTAMSYRPVEGYGGCVMVHMRSSEVMAPINTLRNMVITVVASTITAVALMTFLVTRKLLRMNKERDRLEEDLARQVAQTKAMLEERTRINKVLDERTGELEAVNKELEAFSYSVAHDLRSPLRSIDSFAQLLANKHGDKLDADGRDFLNIIRDSAGKMKELIDSLLQLSRAGRHEMKLRDIDMAETAKSVIQELKASAPERRIEFNVKALPSARAEQTLIYQVFANLISNAVKFTKPVEKAVIEIGCESKEDENIYYVRDNGIGFDPKHVDRMFGVFQRLHDGAEFEGTGIGLAIVQRIIHRHGGRVWAEGKVNGGAAFYFTIPKETSAVGQGTGDGQEKT